MDRLRRSINVNTPEIRTFALQTSYQVACYPMNYAKTLIQIGYEPFPPTKGSFFGNPYLALPNIFQYIRYIKSVDGFWGCYRGLVPFLCQNTVASFVQNQVATRCPYTIVEGNESGNREKTVVINSDWSRSHLETGKLENVLKKTGWQLVCTGAGTIASHPFYVIMVRTVGQFVGRETKYNSLWESITTILDEDGIRGFFVGLAPRLIGDILLVSVSASLVYLINSYIGKNNHTVDQASSMAASVVAHAVSYQFTVVASTIAVNNRLCIGRHPHTIKFDSWLDCWSFLRDIKQLKRGSSIIGRHYMGPVTLAYGEKMPSGFYFGPRHTPYKDWKDVSNSILGIPGSFSKKTD